MNPKSKNRLFLTFILFAVIALAAVPVNKPISLQSNPHTATGFDLHTAVLPQQEEGDKFVLGGSFTLESGDLIDGNLVILGGTATMKEESTVTGDVVVMGGLLDCNGSIGGDLTVVGGLVKLESEAIVEGDVNSISGKLNQEEGASIEGELNDEFPLILPFSLPAIPGLGDFGGDFPFESLMITPQSSLNLLWDLMWLIARSFIWAAVAVLVALFIPHPLKRISHAFAARPFVAGGLGCLTVLVAPIILLALIITICGIPIGMILGFILALAWYLGIIAIGLEVGARFSRVFHQDWAIPVQAGLGVFSLTFVINAIGALVPCIGWTVPTLVGITGLGAVLLTRFGTNDYPPGLVPQSSDLQSHQTAPEPKGNEE